MFKGFRRVIAFSLGLSLLATSTLGYAYTATSTSAQSAHDYTLIESGFENYTTPDNDHGWGIWGPTSSQLLGSGTAPAWTGDNVGIVTDQVHSGSKALGMGAGSALWQRIYDGAEGCTDGDVVEASCWVYAYPQAAGAFIEVDAVDKMANGNKTPIARSRAITADDAGKWIQLATTPYGIGKIPSGSVGGIVMSVTGLSSGKIVVDDFTVQSTGNNGKGGKDVDAPKISDDPYKSLSVYPVQNYNFETSAVSAWKVTGKAKVTIDTTKAYYGNKSAKIVSPSSSLTSLSQIILTGTEDSNSPQVGQTPEAGMWVYLGNDADISKGNISIKVYSMSAKATSGFDRTLVASSGPLAASTKKGQWIYVKTKPLVEALPGTSLGITVSVEDTIRGTVNVDYAEAGQVGAINGNPTKFSMLAYQPWFGNPLDTKNDPSGGWYNWYWDQGGPKHNPSKVLANGQRDIAATFYPEVGPYDSLDPDLLKYQFDIAKAALFNGFMIDDYGREIHQSYRQVENKMFTLAEQNDMKICFQYEAKVNIVGWAPSTASAARLKKVDGIITDLKYILNHYGARKGFLKYNGVPVISIFGAYMLTDDEWAHVKKAIKDQGYNVILMGDGVGQGTDYATINTSFGSMYNWHFMDSTLYPSANPNYKAVYNFAVNNDKQVRRWVSANPQNRFGVGMIWPGFNDNGVTGWGAGTRLSTYLDKDPKGDTIKATAQSVLDSGVNFALVATMNDWNEGTAVEPSKEKGTKYMKELAVFNKTFKGLASVDTSKIDKLTSAYLKNTKVFHFNK